MNVNEIDEPIIRNRAVYGVEADVVEAVETVDRVTKSFVVLFDRY